MIIDTFLFSNEHEADLLYLKMKLESPVVDKFIIQECGFSLKGEYKGLFANTVLANQRFDEFRDKINVISVDSTIHPGYSDEHNNFVREKWQRSFCAEYLKTLPDDALILVSDTDEMIDFSNDNRKDRFFTSVSKDRISWVQRRRYWYDYDNECDLKTIRIPIVPNIIVKYNPSALCECRHYHDESRTFGSYNNPIAFEYSYVFKDVEGLLDKKKNYAHTGFTESSVRGGLHLNCWPRSKVRGEKIRNGDYFETIELTEENSPKYVLENLQTLKTNIVDVNYKENRKNWTSEYTE